MLRITDVVDTRPDGRVTWTLKVEGTLNGEWLPELRRAWRRAQEAEAGAAIAFPPWCATSCSGSRAR